LPFTNNQPTNIPPAEKIMAAANKANNDIEPMGIYILSKYRK
jgi:hypothetical protein